MIGSDIDADCLLGQLTLDNNNNSTSNNNNNRSKNSNFKRKNGFSQLDKNTFDNFKFYGFENQVVELIGCDASQWINNNTNNNNNNKNDVLFDAIVSDPPFGNNDNNNINHRTPLQ